MHTISTWGKHDEKNVEERKKDACTQKKEENDNEEWDKAWHDI